jgi:hypothetical protein
VNRRVVIISLLGNNTIEEERMKRICLLTMILLLFLLPGLSFASDRITLMPNSSKRLDVKRGTGNKTSLQTPHPAPLPSGERDRVRGVLLSTGVNNQGNLSGLKPNNSGGYIGVDSQGKALIITPLRGNLGVDSHGNIWTITSR